MVTLRIYSGKVTVKTKNVIQVLLLDDTKGLKKKDSFIFHLHNECESLPNESVIRLHQVFLHFHIEMSQNELIFLT